MLGHYLLSLTAVEEDRLLLETFEPYQRTKSGLVFGRCVVDVARQLGPGSTVQVDAAPTTRAWTDPVVCAVAVGDRYDMLCLKHGTARINALVRDRIVANRIDRVTHRDLEVLV
jgi:hypothetical protein